MQSRSPGDSGPFVPGSGESEIVAGGRRFADLRARGSSETPAAVEQVLLALSHEETERTHDAARTPRTPGRVQVSRLTGRDPAVDHEQAANVNARWYPSFGTRT